MIGEAGDDDLFAAKKGTLLDGGPGDDELDGSDFDDTFQGGPGNDLATGYEGNDRIAGDAGKDRLEGDEGNDRIAAGGGKDRVLAGAGADVIAAGGGHDTVVAGDGDDVKVTGGGGHDTIGGGAGYDVIRGDAGNDALSTGSGEADTLWGGAGHDRLLGQAEIAALLGEAGDDRIEARGPGSLLDGGPDHDALIGGDHSDTMEGGPGDDILSGGGGDDTAVDGGDGDDTLNGGDGDDVLLAGPGVDKCFGAEGTDTCNGGTPGDEVSSSPTDPDECDAEEELSCQSECADAAPEQAVGASAESTCEGNVTFSWTHEIVELDSDGSVESRTEESGGGTLGLGFVADPDDPRTWWNDPASTYTVDAERHYEHHGACAEASDSTHTGSGRLGELATFATRDPGSGDLWVSNTILMETDWTYHADTCGGPSDDAGTRHLVTPPCPFTPQGGNVFWEFERVAAGSDTYTYSCDEEVEYEDGVGHHTWTTTVTGTITLP